MRSPAAIWADLTAVEQRLWRHHWARRTLTRAIATDRPVVDEPVSLMLERVERRLKRLRRHRIRCALLQVQRRTLLSEPFDPREVC
jgi:hypothetical protein